MEWKQLLLVFGGGSLGSLSRFLTIALMDKGIGKTFPWGTLCVNVVGCFLAGWVFQYLQTGAAGLSDSRIAWLKYGVLIGFLGGFTTFSTFGVETLKLCEQRQNMLALGNIVGNVLLALCAVWLGMKSYWLMGR